MLQIRIHQLDWTGNTNDCQHGIHADNRQNAGRIRRNMSPGCSSATSLVRAAWSPWFGWASQVWSASWPAERAHVGQSARWPSLARTEPPAAEQCSADRGRVRRPGSRGTRPEPLARTGHRSRSCRASRRRAVMVAAGLNLIAGSVPRATSTGWPLRPVGHLGGELADPPHARRGRVGVVAELLGHPAQAAVDAEAPHGGCDCLCCHGVGRGVRSL